MGSYFIETSPGLSDKENGTDFRILKERNIMSRLKHVVGDMWRAGLVVAAGGTVLASSCNTSDVNTVLTGVADITNQLDHSKNDSSNFGDWLSNLLDK